MQNKGRTQQERMKQKKRRDYDKDRIPFGDVSTKERVCGVTRCKLNKQTKMK